MDELQDHFTCTQEIIYNSDDVNLNDQAIFETHSCGIIKGTVVSHDSAKRRIKLDDVTYMNNKTSVSGTRCVFSNDIKRIRILKRSATNDSPQKQIVQDEKVSSKELERLKILAKSYELLTSCNKQYMNAIASLERQIYVGLMAESIDEKIKLIHVLAVTTPQKIYMFDLISIGGVPSDLKQLLENDRIKKITLDTDNLNSYLNHDCGIELKGLFDLQVLYNHQFKLDYVNIHFYYFSLLTAM